MIKLDKENIQIINCIGRKANNIAKLIELNYNVPIAFALEPNSFYTLLEENQIYTTFQNLLESRESFNKIEKLIFDLKETETFTNTLEEINKLNIYPIIIRSSAIDEDSLDESKAGIYTSIGPCFNKKEVFNALKRCWASSFSPLARKYDAGYEPIPLIIQKMIEVDYSGVAFSVDPLNYDNRVAVISLAEGTFDGIESGKLSGITYSINKKDMKIINTDKFETIAERNIMQIVKEIVKLESDLKCGEIDLEWGIKNDELFIFQVRRIIKKKSDIYPQIYSLETEECMRVPIDQLGPLHRRWFRKKYWCRRTANANGILIPKGYYLSYKPFNISYTDIKVIIDNSRCDFFIIDRSSERRTIFVKKDNLLEFLKCEKENEHGFVTLRIRELPIFEISGFSSLIDDKNLLIEYIPGAFSGIYDYGIIPSRYIINSDGEIIDKTIRKYNAKCKFDDINKRFVLKYIDEMSIELEKEIIMEIRRITEIMSEKFGQPRIEWTIMDNSVVMFDISIEKNPLSQMYTKFRILSRGDFEGRVYKILDNAKIKAICDTHTISVDFEKSYYETKQSDLVKKYINQINDIGDKVVIVAKQPITELALLIDNAVAFIFEEGSVLCHLGIILREKNIPAIFIEDACETFENGDHLAFLNDEIRIVSNYERY